MENIYALLKKDHKEFLTNLKQIEKNKNLEKSNTIFQDTIRDLQLHMKGEEVAFYPALEKHAESRMVAFEGEEEHKVAKNVLEDLKASDDEDRWEANFKVFKEMLTHHIEEEEKELFKEAKKVIDKEELMNVTDDFKGIRFEEEVIRDRFE